MTFLQSCWAFRGVGSFWSLRVIAFLCSVMRSVTKSHFALQWWPPPLDFMRNDQRNESPPRTPQEWHAMLRLAPPSLQLKRFQKSLPRCSPIPQKHRRASSEALLQEHGACFWLPSLSFFLPLVWLSGFHWTFWNAKVWSDLKYKRQLSVTSDL